MKKSLAVIAFFWFASSQIFAQEDNSLKAEAGDWNVEVNFAPFAQAPINISYIRLRHFYADNSAFRLGVSLSGKSQSPIEDLTESTFTFNIKPGFENHFAGTNRLSPYIGGELDIAVKTASSVLKRDVGDDLEIDGAWSDTGQERGYVRFGANLVVGADVYIIKNLYLGTEIGYGFEFVQAADIKVSNDEANDDTRKGGSTFQIGPNFNSSIRLGFVF